MPRIICKICHNGYLHYKGKKTRFGKVVEKYYKCDGCQADVTHDLEADSWIKKGEKDG